MCIRDSSYTNHATRDDKALIETSNLEMTIKHTTLRQTGSPTFYGNTTSNNWITAVKSERQNPSKRSRVHEVSCGDCNRSYISQSNCHISQYVRLRKTLLYDVIWPSQ